ncbi:MAG: hypothetical protein ACLP1X_15685 [Polyangiaceae bacterium]
MKIVLRAAFAVALAFVGFGAGPAACGTTNQNGAGDDGGEGGTNYDNGTMAGDGAINLSSSGGGVNMPRSPSKCANGGQTTISGTVYDPANVNPIYNVTVYVPGTLPLPALPNGVSCNSCSDLYSAPQADAVTDATGHFSIPNAPDGPNMPLVVQVGKWRMLYTIANVTACQDNPQPDHSLRLPKNHTEGALPNIAVSTGAADSLECLLLRMGVDPEEYTGGAAGTGRIHIFTGNLFGSAGAVTQGSTSPDPGQTLWNSDMDINQFDVVLLSCEGGETANMNQQVLWDYANGGGRVFASHFHYAWFDSGPFATMINPALATWTTSVELIGNISGNVVTTLPNGMPFPEGTALGKWLGTVGALSGGELPIIYACHNADVNASNTNSQAWISADKNAPVAGATEYFTFDLPVGTSAEGKCGRVVYSDLHASGGAGGTARGSLPGDYAGGLMVVPSQCATGALSPQEKALEFMIFDLSSCLIPPGQNQMPPVVQ